MEITGEEAEAVIDAEELHLRQREEVSDFHLRTAGCWKLTRQVQNMVWHCIENALK